MNTDQRNCQCGEPGGYSIRNANEQSSDLPVVRVIRREPPWYRPEQHPVTLHLTGRQQLCYPGGAFCLRCAQKQLRRLDFIETTNRQP